LFLGLILSAAILTSEGQNATTDELPGDVADDQGIEESISDFFNNSRSKLLNAFKNLSSYLPLNVEYAMTKGQDCDIIKYNRPFYHSIPLILAAVLIVLGAVYAYFGEGTNLYVVVVFNSCEIDLQTML
jgi:hypothetical protein